MRLVPMLSAFALAAPCFLGLAPREARAFCGFFVPSDDKPISNDASMVALMRDGTRTVLSMSNNFKGAAKNFAMVVPVPIILQKDDVKTLPHDVFQKLEELTAPRLVEYWEKDPCDNPCANVGPNEGCGYGMGYGSGMGSVGSATKSTVTVEASFSVGEYDIVILGATESDGLEKWLHEHDYTIPPGASAALAPYVKEQQKFFVAKVDIKKVKLDAQGVAVLSPLRISYESSDFRLPVRLGLLNAPKTGAAPKQDLVIFILSPDKRYDVANYPNAFIPSNLEVTEDTRKSFGAFYAALFDEAVSKGDGHAIVTEYSWGSSSCDPCPTPPLQNSEIATLGGDVLYGQAAPVAIGSKSKSISKMVGNNPMVITRLHARYDAKSLADDLVFRAAPAITGGRESDYSGDGGKLGTGAYPSGYNNFQARYIMRHAWTGPIACKRPERGTWGDMPLWMTKKPKPSAAIGLAAAPRGVVKLASLLKDGLPPIEIVPAGSAYDDDGGVMDASDAGAGGDSSSSAPPVDASFGPGGAPTVAPVNPGSRGCGCAIESRSDEASIVVATLGGVALLLRRRRRGRAPSPKR